MNMRIWLAAGGLALLASGVAAQEGALGLQTFDELPSAAFGDDSDLGKYNYLGRSWVPSDGQIPGEGSPTILDSETIKKLYQCPRGVCPQYVGPGGKGKLEATPTSPTVAPLGTDLVAPPQVADDEVRLDNPQGVELGLRLTLAGVPSVVNIKPAGTHTQKLAEGMAAVAEIASGSTVTTTSLQPGKAYSIQIVSGAYFIVPLN